MTQTFTLTQFDVIRYLYNETSEIENAFIEENLLNDSNLLNFYLDCLDSKQSLNQLELNPSDNSVNKILEFSKMYQPAI